MYFQLLAAAQAEAIVVAPIRISTACFAQDVISFAFSNHLFDFWFMNLIKDMERLNL